MLSTAMILTEISTPNFMCYLDEKIIPNELFGEDETSNPKEHSISWE